MKQLKVKDPAIITITWKDKDEVLAELDSDRDYNDFDEQEVITTFRELVKKGLILEEGDRIMTPSGDNNFKVTYMKYCLDEEFEINGLIYIIVDDGDEW